MQLLNALKTKHAEDLQCGIVLPNGCKSEWKNCYRLIVSDINEPVNIGNPIEMTIKEMAETVIKIIGSTSQLIYKDLPIDDPKIRQPNITKAKELLGWEPKIHFEEGITKTIEWFKTQKLQ